MSSTEPLLQKLHACNWFDCSETSSAFKSRRISNNLQSWRSKPLHGQFLREVETSCDMNFQWKWLSSANLKKESEGFIFACQDQAITTNVVKANIFHLPVSVNCRLCGSCPETIDHLLTGCSVIAQSWYKARHDAVARMIHWELARKGNFEIMTKWWKHRPVPVMHNSYFKLLWDFTIHTDRHLVHNRPDIVCIAFPQKHCYFIDIAIPGNSRISQKATEKIQKYTDLKVEIQKMWSFRTTIVPIIIGSLGSIPSQLKSHLKLLNIFYNGLIPKLQKNVLLNSSHVVRRFITEH